MSNTTSKNAVFASLLLPAMLLSAAGQSDRPDRPVLGLAGSFHYGLANGFLQTPAGGKPGSSSRRRPTLDELHIDDGAFFDLLASAQWRHLGFYAGCEAIELQGHATLERPLVSRNVPFPAGTRVGSDSDLNWLRAGARWRFELAGTRLELSPKVEFAVLDFRYQLFGGGEAVERRYAKGCVRLGLEGRYRCNRMVSVSLDAQASAPLSKTPQIAVLTGGVEFDLLPGSRGFHPVLFLGGGAQRIEYEDDQKLPNHFRVDLGPFLTAGLAVWF